ncbi:MAG: hypothetical protein HFJ02_05440 [Bacilli bacterium]|nr:hypothetical protein [Bacilli bacterium]
MPKDAQKDLFENLTILDSKLIVATKKKVYDIKAVTCGDYVQLYFYENKKTVTQKQETTDLELQKSKIDLPNDTKKTKNKIEVPWEETITEKNIIRSKLECQRLAKANINEWETFITLTFEENITDLEYANKRFKYFIDKVRRIKKDIKYLCITEFQKRGATHYHMLCNININHTSLIYSQEDNPKFKHIKYWNEGFTSVEVIKKDAKKIIGYIAKYMTKDIDNRLFNRHRYFYSRNLIKPIANYINLDNTIDNNFYQKIIQDKKLIYHNEYINPYDKNKVSFLEYYITN